ncbi:Acidic phospholipase A2 1 [Toxocara canis]|uniref:Acidic phospholipase A2 1 n=1 Tax=Toxocara canis TaxID=6265 RepID=A0A0B2V7H0_TOXCA|nr:Acidic phospholipase A2 1 [Toxocara canis]
MFLFTNLIGFDMLGLLVALCTFFNASVTFASRPQILALWNMEGMSMCLLHYTGLVYNSYGCFCGSGGSGYPIDGIDALVCYSH